MMNYNNVLEYYQNNPRVWLITGVAGFIGSNLLKYLLKNNQIVIGIDNFYSGDKKNLIKHKNFTFINHNICDSINISGLDYILHHAAQVSVPESVNNPKLTYLYNINGFNNIIKIAKKNKIKKLIYASSSAIYGDNYTPYSISKLLNEIFANISNINNIGFRYFNIYGPNQNIKSDYSAVIPKWINLIKENKPIQIYGDGSTIRDFCYIDDVIIANILACYFNISHHIFNIGTGIGTSLNMLIEFIFEILNKKCNIEYLPFRENDIQFSIADIKKAKQLLNFNPTYDLYRGLNKLIEV